MWFYHFFNIFVSIMFYIYFIWLFLILCNSWSFFVTVQLCPNLILYKKITIHSLIHKQTPFLIGQTLHVSLFQVKEILCIWSPKTMLIYESYSHILARLDNSFDSSQLFLDQSDQVIMPLFVTVDLDLWSHKDFLILWKTQCERWKRISHQMNESLIFSRLKFPRLATSLAWCSPGAEWLSPPWHWPEVKNGQRSFSRNCVCFFS